MRPRFVGQFDSASTLVRVIAATIEGKGTAGLALQTQFRLAARASAWVPQALRARLYSRGALREAVSPDELQDERQDAVADWFVSQYRSAERFPALFIGATNGAIAEPAAAMGAAFLPQTFLLLMRAPTTDVDDIRSVIARTSSLGAPLARAFPDAAAYQMHDPENDRLVVRHAAYFRMKWRRLPPAYRAFVEDRLMPGGTIFIVGCEHPWPALRLSDRHTLQVGGHGGVEPRAILKRYGLSQEPALEKIAESEWGYDDALTADLAELAASRGFGLVRLVFGEPQTLSAPIAQFFRDHVVRRPRGRLVVTSFNMLAPAHVLLTDAVPYWSVFNDLRSLSTLEQFLRTAGPFDEISALLFQNGVAAHGQATAEQWQEVLSSASASAKLVGVRPDQHPFDFAAFDRYRRTLQRMEPPGPAERLVLKPGAVVDRLRGEGLTVERLV